MALLLFIAAGVLAGQQETERAAAHEALDRAKDAEGVHDACGALLTVGDSSSVPHLIRALRFFPDFEVSGPRFGVIDTQGHCVEALQRITGQRLGYTFSAWKQWWDAAHAGNRIPICEALMNGKDGAGVVLRGDVTTQRGENLTLHVNGCTEVIVLEGERESKSFRRLRERVLELHLPRHDLVQRENPHCFVHVRVKGILDVSQSAGWSQKTNLRGYGQPEPFTRYRLRVKSCRFSDDFKGDVETESRNPDRTKYLRMDIPKDCPLQLAHYSVDVYFEDPTSRHLKFALRNTSGKAIDGLSYTIKPVSGDGSMEKGGAFAIPRDGILSEEFEYSAAGDCEGEEYNRLTIDTVWFADGSQWTRAN